MPIIYLIGPSGVGKSICARYAASALGAKHLNLDELCAGRQFDWNFCQEVLTRIDTDVDEAGVIRIVDIGAGIQCAQELRQYLLPRRDRVVLIFAPAEDSIGRNPFPRRGLVEYSATEYESRRSLYAIARHRLSVSGLSETEARQQFTEYVQQHFAVASVCDTDRAV